MNTNRIIAILMAFSLGLISCGANSTNKKKSEVQKDDNRSTSEFKIQAGGKNITVKGRFNEFSVEKIKDAIKENIVFDGEDFATRLLATKMFETVEVNSAGKTVNIVIVENPVLGKWVINVRGAPKPPKDEIEKATKFTRRSHVYPEKVRMLAQQLKNTYIIELATKNVDVQVYEKYYDGYVDLTFDINVVPEKNIEDIIFVGNKQLSSRLLGSAARSRKRGMNPLPLLTYNVISEEDAEDIGKAITFLAKAKGFLDFKINSITTEVNKFNKKMLVIALDEGPKYKVRNVELISDVPEDQSPKHLMRELRWATRRIVKGHGFDQFKFEATKNSLNAVIVNTNLMDYDLDAQYEKIPGTEEVKIVFRVKRREKNHIIRKVIIENNNITRDSTIMRHLYFEAGDQVSDAVIQYTKSKLEASDLFKSVDVKVLDVDGDDKLKDIQITVEEKNLLEGEVGLNTSTEDILLNGAINGKTKNFLGTGFGMSARLELGTMPGLGFVFTSPGLFTRDSVALVEFSISEMSLGRSGLFGPSTTFDYIIAALCGLKYQTIPDLVTKLSQSEELDRDAKLPSRELDHLISPYWKDKSKPIPMSEFKVGIRFGNQFRFGENHSLYIALGFNQRIIRKNSSGLQDIFNVLKDKNRDDDDKSLDTLLGGKTQRATGTIQLNKYVDGGNGTTLQDVVRHTGQIIDEASIHGEEAQIDANGDVVLNVKDKDGNIVPSTKASPTLTKAMSGNNKTRVFLRGLGENKILMSQKRLTEKLEIEQVVAYQFNDSIHQIELPYMLGAKATFVTGTTSAVKIELKAGITKQLNELISLGITMTFGRSFNNHYLDNFNFKELGFCNTCGPIELYDFTYLGGRNLFKLESTMTFNLFSHHVCDIVPYMKVGFGSIWDCGIEKMRLPEDVANKRGWKTDTVDIAQDDFNMIGVFTPGVAIKFGPVQVNFGVNVKFLDKYSNLNKNNGLGGLDFSIGMSV